MFTRRQLAEATYRLRHATHPSWDVADDATLQLRLLLSTPAKRFERRFAPGLLEAASVPVGDVFGADWRSSKHYLNRLGDDSNLLDLCLWSITWWTAFNVISPTWGVGALRVLWAHAGGSVRERFTLPEVWEARRRIRCR